MLLSSAIKNDPNINDVKINDPEVSMHMIHR
jgi:hypothetical protein